MDGQQAAYMADKIAKSEERQSDIALRYANAPEDIRDSLLTLYEITDTSLEALEIMHEAHRQMATSVITSKNGKTKTIIPLASRIEYDDFMRRRTLVMEIAGAYRKMKHVFKKAQLEDRQRFEKQFVKIEMLMRSLMNYRYVIEGAENEQIQPHVLPARHAAFARRLKLLPGVLQTFRFFGGTRMERFLELLEERFTDFSKAEKFTPNMGPDRPFFIKQAPPSLEEDLLAVFYDIEKTIPYRLSASIERVQPISTGNIRGLRDFLENMQGKGFDHFLHATFDMIYRNKFVTRHKEWRAVTDIFMNYGPVWENVAFGLGFSPGILAMIRLDREYWLKKFISPVQISGQVLVMYYCLGILHGCDTGQERAIDTHSVIESLLEFPERKGVHFIGIVDTTLGVLVQ